MLVYDKLFELLKERGITSYTLRKNPVISQGTLTKLKNNEQVNSGVINNLCALLDCQPADIMEYIPDRE